MNTFKIAVLQIVLLVIFIMAGCATIGLKTTAKFSDNPSFFQDKKVSLSSFTIVEKDMQTKKVSPDLDEKAAGEEVYAALKEKLSRKGLLVLLEGANNALGMDLRVHHATLSVMEWLGGGYYENAAFERLDGAKILVTRLILKDRDGKNVIEINSVDSSGAIASRSWLVPGTVDSLVENIEKVLRPKGGGVVRAQ